MGKRSDFARRPQDAYQTPDEGVLSLLPHLRPQTRFIEPCAGEGRLIGHLERRGHVCIWASDTSSDLMTVLKQDALTWPVDAEVNNRADCFLTNPPWTRKLLHPMIERLSNVLPTWLLFDADWMHTMQAKPMMDYCQLIVSAGRISWMENGVRAKDNAAWYYFDQTKSADRSQSRPEFIGWDKS